MSTPVICSFSVTGSPAVCIAESARETFRNRTLLPKTAVANRMCGFTENAECFFLDPIFEYPPRYTSPRTRVCVCLCYCLVPVRLCLPSDVSQICFSCHRPYVRQWIARPVREILTTPFLRLKHPCCSSAATVGSHGDSWRPTEPGSGSSRRAYEDLPTLSSLLRCTKR